MRIAALLKPIPDLEAAASDPERVWRTGEGQLTTNPFCRRAVAQACELAAADGDGTVTVVALGPPSVADLVRRAMTAAEETDVDCDGVLLADPAFSGGDTLATARALAATLDVLGGFDLVLTGGRGVDRDIGGVGPQVAELLALPFVTGARYLSLQRATLHIRAEHDDGWEQVDVELPAVVSCAERLIDPSPAGTAGGPATEIRSISVAELGPGPWGATANATTTDAVRTRAATRAHVVLAGDPDEQIRETMALLGDRRALDGPADDTLSVPPAGGECGVAVAVLVEPDRADVSRELLGAAARLAVAIDGHTVALSPAPPDAATLAAWGADAVVHLDGSDVEEDVAGGVASWARIAGPWAILAPSTAYGREVAARAAVQLDAGLIGEAVDLRVDGDDRVVASAPVLGGQLLAAVSSESRVQVATVRPGSLALPAPRAAGRPEVRTLVLEARSRVRVRSRTRDDDLGALARAHTVVGVGLGVDRDEYSALAALVQALGAELAATRPVTDRRWLPRDRQVGLTGRAIAPRLYVAIGIRGAFEHMVGVCAAGTVLAIHSAGDAPVFARADIGIVGDWRDVVPRLVDALAAAGVGAGVDA